MNILSNANRKCFLLFTKNKHLFKISEASKPTNFRVLCSNSDSITVSWDAPEFPRGLIHSYDISYDKSFDALPPSSIYGMEGMYGMNFQDFASKSQQFITQEVQGTQHDNFDLRIDQLNPNTTYYFRVSNFYFAYGES